MASVAESKTMMYELKVFTFVVKTLKPLAVAESKTMMYELKADNLSAEESVSPELQSPKR